MLFFAIWNPLIPGFFPIYHVKNKDENCLARRAGVRASSALGLKMRLKDVQSVAVGNSQSVDCAYDFSDSNCDLQLSDFQRIV